MAAVSVRRAIIAATALILAATVGRVSLANVLAQSQPSSALMLDGKQSNALALQSYLAIFGTTAPDPKRAVALSRAALRIDPTNAAAAAYLGLALELTGPRDIAARLMTYSQRLSRRNLVTQLWFIEYHVRQGDIAGALAHYDTALRISPVAPTILFPTLVSATANDPILVPLARMLAQRPAWAEQYVQQLVQSGTSLANITKILVLLRAEGSPAPDRALATLVDRLVAVGRLDLAWKLYLAYRPTARQNEIRNGEFTKRIESPTAFDWILRQNNSVSADIREGALNFAIGPSMDGPVAKQLLALSPGPHLIQAEVANIPSLAENPPVLVLQCLADGHEISRLPLLPSDETARRQSWDLTVSPLCPIQSLTLVTPLVDSPSQLASRIDRLNVVH